VCILAERQAVPQRVVPRVSEAVDMRCIDDACPQYRCEKVTRQGAGVVVCSDDEQSEPGLTPLLGCLLDLKRRTIRIGRLGIPGREVEQFTKCHLLKRLKVVPDQNTLRIQPVVLVGHEGGEIGINRHGSRRF
jgi:hypothetical protein